MGPEASRTAAPARALLISSLYPSYADIYKYGFVHRRVVEYRRRGFAVDVVRPQLEGRSTSHLFDGVVCRTLSRRALAMLLRRGGHRSIAIHGLSEALWEVVAPHLAGRPVTFWVHGTELLDFSHVAYAYEDAPERERAQARFARRLAFWRELLRESRLDVRLVFVSQFSAELAMADLGLRLDPRRYTVIPNPIDTRLFAYRPKPPELARRVLSLRPFKSRIHGSDLIAEAILKLSRRAIFPDLQFSVVGDGPTFEEMTASLHGLANVRIRKTFLLDHEIVAEHALHGVFLVPSRFDTQGVSRDEAMASGLVPVTNAVCAVPEFVDETCGVLAPADDGDALAEGIERLARQPRLFQRMSRAAARRKRAQTCAEIVIPREIAYLEQLWA